MPLISSPKCECSSFYEFPSKSFRIPVFCFVCLFIRFESKSKLLTKWTLNLSQREEESLRSLVKILIPSDSVGLGLRNIYVF